MPKCIDCKHWDRCRGILQTDGYEYCYEEASPVPYTIKAMIDKFGEDSQIDVAIEEMSELIKELVKYKRSKIHFREKQATSHEHVVEEIGDVMFMIEYLKTIFNITDKDIQGIVKEKAVRTRKRYLDGKE